MILETKLATSFPKSEFIIPGFTEPYRIDRTLHGAQVSYSTTPEQHVLCLTMPDYTETHFNFIVKCFKNKY